MFLKSIAEIAPQTDYTAKQLAWIRSNYGEFPQKKSKRLAASNCAYEFLYDENEVMEWLKSHKERPKGAVGRTKRKTDRTPKEIYKESGIDNKMAQAFIRKPFLNLA